jgi:hypothetical protein
MKRITLVAGVTFFMLTTTAASCASTSASLGSGTSKHPAAADIAITSCTVPAAPLNVPKARGIIINHSSGTSDYSFTISFVSDPGTVLAQGAVAENGVAPGQSANFEVTGNTHVTVPSVRCLAVNVTRFASGG